jgi:hypothetical protein
VTTINDPVTLKRIAAEGRQRLQSNKWSHPVEEQSVLERVMPEGVSSDGSPGGRIAGDGTDGGGPDSSPDT